MNSTADFDWIPLRTFTSYLSKPSISAFKRVVFFKDVKSVHDDMFKIKEAGASKSSGILIRSDDYKIPSYLEKQIVAAALKNSMKLYEFQTLPETNLYLPTDLNDHSRILILLHENP